VGIMVEWVDLYGPLEGGYRQVILLSIHEDQA
jgi:hypothetical protein